MMICNADFDELFPAAASEVPEPSAACIARWEDDGGRAFARSALEKAPTVRSAHDGYRIADPARVGLAFATMSAAATYGAAWIMFTTYDQMMGG